MPPITFLFTDMEGSTRFWEASPDAMRASMARHDALLAEGIESHNGQIVLERGEGDSFFAIFDDAADAIAAAGSIQRALADEEWPGGIPVKIRMAIHTGEADANLRGPDVNRCARLRAIAHGGQVLVSAAARGGAAEPGDGGALLDLGLHRLRDLTEPERVFQLVLPGLLSSFPPLRSMEAFRHNLPIQLTRFIGREKELTELRELACERPVVTIVGPGGSGKTRLALQLAADLLDDFEDGCWFVDLAPLSDPGLVPLTVAQVLEVREEADRPALATLTQHVAGKRLLLILDNCEHVIQAAAEVAAALARRAPGVRLVATSRESLAIPGELAWPVSSLDLPDLERIPSEDEILGYEAIRLFCDRAVAARPGFAPGPGDGALIARICARLDGIPLAIELAAARVKVLGLGEILARLEDRLRLLTGGSRVVSRHQTLRAAIEWSHQLLSEKECVLFRRLAAFAGAFDLAAAEAVGSGEPLEDWDVLDLIGRLVDKSLLLVDTRGEQEMGYRFLETLRQYAVERLDESGEADAVRDRHLQHFLELAERAWAERIDAEALWLARLERRHDNLRAALARARERRPADHLRLAGALGWFWQLHGHLSEGRAHLTEALAGPEGASPALARALWSAGTLAAWQGDSEPARAALEESRKLYEALGDRLGVALCLDSLGWAMILTNHPEGALSSWEEGLRIQKDLGHRRLIQLAEVAVCQGLVALGDVEQAEPMSREILATALEAGDDRNTHFGYHFLADCALYREEGAEAERLYAASLRAALAYGDETEATFEVEGVAMASACQGRPGRALLLGGAVESRREELGVSWSLEFWERFRDRFFGGARDALGTAAADATWTEGRSMGWERAVKEASPETAAAAAM